MDADTEQAWLLEEICRKIMDGGQPKFTDDLPRRPDGTQFGLPRLEALLRATAGAMPEVIVIAVLAHAAGRSWTDDVTSSSGEREPQALRSATRPS